MALLHNLWHQYKKKTTTTKQKTTQTAPPAVEMQGLKCCSPSVTWQQQPEQTKCVTPQTDKMSLMAKRWTALTNVVVSARGIRCGSTHETLVSGGKYSFSAEAMHAARSSCSSLCLSGVKHQVLQKEPPPFWKLLRRLPRRRRAATAPRLLHPCFLLSSYFIFPSSVAPLSPPPAAADFQ